MRIKISKNSNKINLFMVLHNLTAKFILSLITKTKTPFKMKIFKDKKHHFKDFSINLQQVIFFSLKTLVLEGVFEF